MVNLLDLPLPLFQDILVDVFSTSERLNSILHLRLVNRIFPFLNTTPRSMRLTHHADLFNYEAIKFLARNRLNSIPYTEEAPIPETFKISIVRAYIGDAPRPRSSPFVPQMHAVADQVLRLVNEYPSAETQAITRREDVIDQIAQVSVRCGYHRALFGADYKFRGYRAPCPSFASRLQRGFKYGPKEPQADLQSTALVICILSNWTHIFASLIRTGAYAPSRLKSFYFNRSYNSAVATSCSPAMIQIMLDHGFKPDLTWATRSELLKLERKSNCVPPPLGPSDWSTADKKRSWNTVVHKAAQSKRWDVVRFLVEKGCRPCGVWDRQHVIYLALEDEETELAKNLIEREENEIFGTVDRLYWLLVHALRARNMVIVDWTLAKVGEKGVDNGGIVRLHVTRGGNENMLEFFVQRGLKVPPYKELWMIVCRTGKVNMARWVVAQGYVPSLAEPFGNERPDLVLPCSLLYAIAQHSWDMVYYLVQELGVDINGHAELKHMGYSPLQMVIDKGTFFWIKDLLALGANKLTETMEEDHWGEEQRKKRWNALDEQNWGFDLRFGGHRWKIGQQEDVDKALAMARDG